jgi:hypothetical protein
MGGTKGSGMYGSGPNPAANIPRTVVYEGPEASGPDEVSGAPYGQAPYVRVQLPDRGTVDALAQRWSRTHVLIHSEANYEVFNAWVPVRWVQRITEEESSWRDPDRLRQPRDR